MIEIVNVLVFLAAGSAAQSLVVVGAAVRRRNRPGA